MNDSKLTRTLLYHKTILIALLTLLAFTPFKVAAAQFVFPGAEGFGTETVAGRGGIVYRVTNLDASGDGSLDTCLKASGRRVCIFEVSGTIELVRDLTIRNPYITIAGQTAPSPGITLKGVGIHIITHDVLIQHLRIRVGDNHKGPAPGNRDGIAIAGLEAYNIVIDHCSISWGVDENVSLWYDGVHDVTLRNCIISEGLYNSIHPKGPHSMGILIGKHVKNVALIGNLLAHNNSRNPLIQGLTETLIINNVIYNPNWAAVALTDSHRVGHIKTSIVGNVVIRGPSTNGTRTAVSVHDSVTDGTKVYVSDNECESKTLDPWSCVAITTRYDMKSVLPPLWVSPLTVRSSAETKEWVLNNVGARPVDRDSVDIRVVRDARDRTGRIINSQNDVGGWPVLAENRRALTLPNDPNGDNDNDGSTNLEEWLHELAVQVEGHSNSGEN